MKITMWRTDKVIPYARNPRQITEQAISKVAASLKEFGWQQPIVVDEGGVIIVGHTRLMGAQRLGMTEVPVHVATGLSRAQIAAYRIADNRTGEEAKWDKDLLAVEFGELDGTLEQIASLTAFDVDEINKICDISDETEDEPGGNDAVDSRFEVVITCQDEAHQEQVFQELAEEGYQCRVLSM